MSDSDGVRLHHATGPHPEPHRDAGWRGIAVFCLIAYALAWLVALPLWLGDGLASPFFLPCSVAMMFTPTVASVVVVRFMERRPVLATLGIKPAGSAARLLIWLLIAIVAVFAVVVLGLLSSAALGTYSFDLANMSAFRLLLEQQLEAVGSSADDLPMPIRVMWLLQFVNLAAASLMNTLPAAGEEIGWRGFLFPRLRDRLGATGAVLASGVIWGAWHAPLILLGYNYPSNPRMGVLMMCVSCIGLGALLAWVSQRGASVWPAALGHGAFNAMMSGTIILFGDASVSVDTMSATLMGWGGWPVWLLLVVVLLATRAFRPYVRSGS
ncbi:MAG: CPBP family intramembrane glutamic endopeptidase [Brooklawnia sp.]|uniref:CPBP family intramembrane glutamic endopeptidase n=1 Tax=Brooklawnia sp. TaxID=2699740 RepID=UPI003C712E26